MLWGGRSKKYFLLIFRTQDEVMYVIIYYIYNESVQKAGIRNVKILLQNLYIYIKIK